MRKIVILLHAIIIIAAYSAPLWLDWRLVTAGVGVYWLQLIIFKHCVLSTAQFGDKETTFHEWYLAKVGVHPNHTALKRLLNIWIPLFLLLIAGLLQLVAHYQPPIHI
jgi:hypothetical protein